MGTFWVSKQDETLRKAKQIRQQLYQRINLIKPRLLTEIKKLQDSLIQKIIRSSATELVTMLDNHEITSYNLVLIFASRSCTIAIQNNYVLDEMFKQALQKATECDQMRNNLPDRRSWRIDLNQDQYWPPFYGIPLSVKESLLIAGKQSYAGFVSKLNKIPSQNGLFVQMALTMGFIPFIRTNVPQACKAIQTNNNIFGYSKNAWNNTRSCGGSSGGQGGLIGAHCSCFGLGSDIGGSLRTPAEWNGLVTLKAACRYSNFGNSYYGAFIAGSPIRSQLGPITRSVEDLITFSHFMYNQANYERIPRQLRDQYSILKPFDRTIFLKKPKLTIGYVTHLDQTNCSKSHQRVVNESVAILEKQGHKIKQFSLHKFEQFYYFMFQMFLCDNKLSIFTQLQQGQPLIKQYKTLQKLFKIPWLIRKIIFYYLKNKQPRMANFIKLSRSLKPEQIFQKIYAIKKKLSHQLYQRFIHDSIDVLITPGFALPSPQYGQTNKFQHCYSYVSSWNVLEYPAGSLPVSLVRANQTDFTDQFNDIFTKNMQNSIRSSEGLPVGIQVVSLPRQEQMVLYVMSILEEKIQFRQKYPCPILRRKIL